MPFDEPREHCQRGLHDPCPRPAPPADMPALRVLVVEDVALHLAWAFSHLTAAARRPELTVFSKKTLTDVSGPHVPKQPVPALA